MEMLKGHNWMPWKRRMLAVLRDSKLEQYIERESRLPAAANPNLPTESELETQTRWREGNAKARTNLELAISDSEIIHIIGATTASEMWKQLTMVKESKGKLGVLALRRTLYRTVAEEGFVMVDHISKLRKIQEELHLMESKVTDEDFAIILLSSLPESWDVYTSAYLGSSMNSVSLTSHELIAVLLEEDRCCKERSGDPSAVAMQGKGPNKNAKRNKPEKSDVECYNCHKKGHMAKDCFASGGGKAGQGPKQKKGGYNRSNQAQDTVNNLLSDVSYMSLSNADAYSASNGPFSRYDWIFDSGTMSNIATMREAFIDYTPLTSATVKGLSQTPAQALGRGTVLVNFKVDGKLVLHRLKDVLHVPEVPNCLISSSRFDDIGGTTETKNGVLTLKDKVGKVVGKASKINRLWLLDARAQLKHQESSNVAKTNALPWDEWHKHYGHLGRSGLERLHKSGMVQGLNIDESTIHSTTCETCIQAKQAHRPKNLDRQ